MLLKAAGSRRSRSGRLHFIFIMFLKASVAIFQFTAVQKSDGGKRTRKAENIKKYGGRKEGIMDEKNRKVGRGEIR